MNRGKGVPPEAGKTDQGIREQLEGMMQKAAKQATVVDVSFRNQSKSSTAPTEITGLTLVHIVMRKGSRLITLDVPYMLVIEAPTVINQIIRSAVRIR